MSVMPAGSFASITDEAFGLQGVDLGPTQPLLDDLVDFGLPAPLDALSLGAGGSLTSLAASLGIALAEADPLVNIAGTLEFGDMATLPPFASLAASLAFGSAALSVGLGPQPELFEPLDLGLGDPLTQLNDFLQFDARPTLSVVHSLTSMTLSVGAVVPGLGDGDLLADFELPGTLQDFMLPNMGLLSASSISSVATSMMPAVQAFGKAADRRRAAAAAPRPFVFEDRLVDVPLEASDPQRAASPQGIAPVALPSVQSDDLLLDLNAMDAEKDIEKVLQETLAELEPRGAPSEGMLVLDMMEPQLSAMGHVSLGLPHLSVQNLPVLSGLPAWHQFSSYGSLPLFCRDSHAHLLVENAYGEIGQQGDGVGFPKAGSEAAARDERERRFSFMRAHPPATRWDLSGTLEGRTAYSAYNTSGAEFGVMQQPRATSIVNTALRAPLVDGVPSVNPFRSTVVVAYQVRDDSGNTHVDRSMLVTADVQHEDGVTRTTGTCTWVFISGGIGECNVYLSEEWFASPGSASVTVSFSYDGVEVARSDTLVVGLLMDTVTHPLLTEVGMVATMPTASVCSGETFPVEVRAHTGAVAVAELTAWQLTIEYDPDVLEFVGESSRLYRLTSLHGAGVVVINTASAKFEFTEADTLEHWPRKQTYSVTSDRVNMYLATLEFRVLDTIKNGTYDEVLSMRVDDMTNQQGNAMILAPKPGQINDLRGGAQSSGQLVVEYAPEVLTVFAFPSTGEPANTAKLNGVDVVVEIFVVEVTDRPCFPMHLTTSTADFSCSIADEAAAAGLFVLGAPCSALLTSSMTRGGTASVLVQSHHCDANMSVPVTVWFPQQLSVQVADDTLNRIDGSEACTSSLYQQTEATAVAVFGSPGLGGVGDIDVTDLVTFEGKGSSITLSGRVVYAHYSGSAIVTISGAAMPVISAHVSVVDAAVTVVALQSAVVTEVVWSQPPPATVSWAVSASFAARVRLRQRLHNVGDRGTVEASVLFSDGQTWLVPPDELFVTSGTDSLLVNRTLDAPSRWEVEVPVGALYHCDYLLRVEWRPCTNVRMADALTLVDVRMPRVSELIVTFADPRLTDPDDSAAVSPISVATRTHVIVMVRYVDSDGVRYDSEGTTDVDFTYDERTVVTLDGNHSGCVSFDAEHRELQVLDGATYPSQRCTEARVTVTLSAFGGMTATASIPIVAFVSLEMTLLPFPTFPGADEMIMSTLRLLDCTTCRQLARAHVVAALSDGTEVRVFGASTSVSVVGLDGQGEAGSGSVATDSPGATNSSGHATVFYLWDQFVLRPASAGAVTLEARFHERNDASFTVLISDEHTQITEVSLKLPLHRSTPTSNPVPDPDPDPEPDPDPDPNLSPYPYQRDLGLP